MAATGLTMPVQVGPRFGGREQLKCPQPDGAEPQSAPGPRGTKTTRA
jgi:hypothetical protein